MTLIARNHNLVIQPDPLAESSNGIILNNENTNYRTGTIKSVGPKVEWDLMKEGRKVLYRQRNCVQYEGLHIIEVSAVEDGVGKNVTFSHEERIGNKTKVHLKTV